MADKSKKCQHREAKVARSYFDAQGKPRVRHAFAYCHAPAVAVDVYGYGYCADHRASGDFGQQEAAADLDLAAILAQLKR